ncbi:hypothetical protein BDV30DRAFT_213241 [Aspergillus minisclerotigenes]|uniref:Uncharacterized protein n=1 Tax=Aspergillus minisclerotigenes TaxID=656917 RepID=A0A5N6J089_9EURO|nr:hypothetical protein BDV30DRAFT_213241 [Aspergillus minisclerotigenes]
MPGRRVVSPILNADVLWSRINLKCSGHCLLCIVHVLLNTFCVFTIFTIFTH